MKLIISKFNEKTKMEDTYTIDTNNICVIKEDEECNTIIYLKNGNNYIFSMEDFKEARVISTDFSEILKNKISDYNNMGV